MYFMVTSRCRVGDQRICCPKTAEVSQYPPFPEPLPFSLAVSMTRGTWGTVRPARICVAPAFSTLAPAKWLLSKHVLLLHAARSRLSRELCYSLHMACPVVLTLEQETRVTASLSSRTPTLPTRLSPSLGRRCRAARESNSSLTGPLVAVLLIDGTFIKLTQLHLRC